MTDQAEFYPMPAFPTLSVRDVDASVRWYRDVLGFQPVFAMPGLAHLRWARYADLLLRTGAATDATKGVGITLSFAVSDVDTLAARVRAAGHPFLQEPGDRPWNARDFTLADPDGFALTFTMGPLKRDAAFEDVMKGTQN
jgi:catechol 2,3-dioxygenase-like lactoylglutathione lyase family enzyme